MIGAFLLVLFMNSSIISIIHVKEVTQPQGHTTSGSHERYKSKDRLQWEKDFCCIKKNILIY